MARNRKTLSHVTPGFEAETVSSYFGTRRPVGFGEIAYSTKKLVDGLQVQLLHTFGKGQAAAKAMKSVLTIESLYSIGIDCSGSPQVEITSMLDSKGSLRYALNLVLIWVRASLPYTLDEVLIRRRYCPGFVSFKLRQEDVDALLRESLKASLLATDGVVHLSVLLEGCHHFVPPDCLANHGSALWTVVWDQRPETSNKA